jgi:cysteine-rich repeat protein
MRSSGLSNFVRSACRILPILFLGFAVEAHAWVVDFEGGYLTTLGDDKDQMLDAVSLPGGDVIAVGLLDHYLPDHNWDFQNTNWLVARLDLLTGAVEWSVEIQKSATANRESAKMVALLPDGNVVVAGDLVEATQLVSVAKISAADGSVMWRRDVVGAITTDMAVDSAGDVVVTYVESSDLHVAKYDGDNGTPLWSFNPAVSTSGFAQQVLVDSAGDVFAAGSITSPSSPNTGSAGVLIKIDGANGSEMWRQEVIAETGNSAGFLDAAWTSGGDIVLAGGAYFAGSMAFEAFVLRLDAADASEIWGVHSAPIDFANGMAIALNSSDDVYVTGYSYCLTRLDGSDGSTVWSETYGTQCVPGDVTVLADGSPVITGYLYDGVSYGFGALRAAAADGAESWHAILSSSQQGNKIIPADGNPVAVGYRTTTTYDPPYTYYSKLASVVRFDGNTGITTSCGDTIVEPGEQCDDGNDDNGDCCSSTCQFEPEDNPCDDGIACSTGDHCNASGICVYDENPCLCGNGSIDAGETCDDGNTANGDCCSSTCQPSNLGSPCDSPAPSTCTPTGACDAAGTCSGGDNECSCGTAHLGHGCAESACEACVAGIAPYCNTPGYDWDSGCLNVVTTSCLASCSTAGCGDFTRGGGEQCEDHNGVPGDCCDGECQFEEECRESFKLYQAKTAKDAPAAFTPTTVTLVDSFHPATQAALSKPDSVCPVVDIDGAGVIDATANLECYKAKDPAFAPLAATYVNQLQTVAVEASKVSKVCYPASRDGVPTDLDRDAMRCFKAKASGIYSPPAIVLLTDDLETKATVVGKPSLLCLAAADSFANIEEPARALVCYKIKDSKEPPQAKFAGATVDTETTFGEERLTAKKAKMLCVGSVLSY